MDERRHGVALQLAFGQEHFGEAQRSTHTTAVADAHTRGTDRVAAMRLVRSRSLMVNVHTGMRAFDPIRIARNHHKPARMLEIGQLEDVAFGVGVVGAVVFCGVSKRLDSGCEHLLALAREVVHPKDELERR